MNASFHERFRWPLLAAFVCLLPLVLWGAASALSSNSNDVRTWLPQGLPETIEYASFGRHFGSEEFVAVSWEGCTLDDKRLEKLARRLKQRTDDRDSLIESVITGPEAIEQLTSPPAKLSHDEAAERLKGLMVGPDGRQSCAIVRPTERGKHDPRLLLDTLRADAIACGIPAAAIRMGGPPVTSSSIDEAAAHSLALPGPVSVLLALVFSWICFRSLRLTLPVIAIGAFSAAAALAVVWFTGGMMNAVLLSMPPLVYVATTSGAIHWANYYRDAVAEGGAAGAPGRAVAHARLPLFLATATTSIGLLSLCASELLPIRDFGVYSAIGVAAGLIWLLVILPACIAAFRPRNTSQVKIRTRIEWRPWGQRIVGATIPITLVCLVFAGLCAFGLQHVKTTVSAEEFFTDDAELPRTSRWLEERLGGMVPMELVVRFDRDCPLTVLERMELVERVQQSVASLDDVSTSVSAVTFGPPLPEDSGGRYTVRRSVFNRRLERNRDKIADTGFLAFDEGDELWRISLRTRSFHNVDQRYFIDEVRKHALPVIEEECEHSGDHISATFTGMVPLINRAQQSLLEGLCLGLVTDLVLIVVTVIVLMRHWSAGLIMLATCLLPTLVVLGLMGWLEIPLDIGSVLAPSVALGVSVDDVLHFVLTFRRGVSQGLDRRQSIRLAYQTCARAMFQSWGVIGLGLGVFALSDFTPTHRFGLLMLLLVSVGLVVNLLLLPALLAGPLGGVLAGSLKRKALRHDGAMAIAAP
jgi:predicted RND superfamily exporter protein